MAGKILLGYSGSWAFGVTSFYQIERLKEKLKKNPANQKAKHELERIKNLRANRGTPVYVSKEKYNKLKEWKEMQHYSTWL